MDERATTARHSHRHFSIRTGHESTLWTLRDTHYSTRVPLSATESSHFKSTTPPDRHLPLPSESTTTNKTASFLSMSSSQLDCELDRMSANVGNITVTDFKTKSKQKIIDIQSALRKGVQEQQVPSSSPVSVFREKSTQWGVAIESAEFARRMDQEDPLASIREQFNFPKKASLPNIDQSLLKSADEDCIYLCGQSLGLKPKSLDENVQKVLDSWSQRGVHSHFHGYMPAALSDLPAKKPMASLVGTKENNVAILNGLTVNLHLLLATFYRPNEKRFKIIIEEHAFPSDTYVAKSQLRSHGISPEEGLVTMKPRKGENLLNEDDIIRLLEEEGDQVAVALLPAVQYYTGQVLDVARLTKVAQKKGVIVGVDLAHAIGNIPIHLDDWNVDFAAWCTYKYLNSGAGGMGAIYINDRYLAEYSETFPMYQGWWGNNNKTKFLMKEDFDPALGADSFKLSNPSPVLNAMLMSSLEIFSQTTVEERCRKQFLLTGYLEFMMKSFFPQKQQSKNGKDHSRNDFLMPSVEIITPSDTKQRGCQLSLMFSVPLSIIQEHFQKRGIVCDIRMPSVMRVAPTPLYNSFTDVYKFISNLYEIFQNIDSLTVTANNQELLEEAFTVTGETERSYSSISSDSEADSVSGSNTL